MPHRPAAATSWVDLPVWLGSSHGVAAASKGGRDEFDTSVVSDQVNITDRREC